MDDNACENPSRSNITNDYWGLEGDLVYGQVTAAFLLMYISIGLPWNILVVTTIFWKKLYLQPTVMLLLDLAVTDILFVIPILIISITGCAGEYAFGHSDDERCRVCKFGGVLVTLAMNCIFVVALMSLDRFLYIYKPLVYERKSNKLGMLASITVTAILSLFLGLVPLAQEGLIGFSKAFMSCLPSVTRNWYSGLLVGLSSIALVVIIVCNVWVICIARRNIKAIYCARKSIKNDDYDKQMEKRLRKECYKKQIHLFRVFGLLILSNSISWMPKILIFCVRQFKEEFYFPPSFFLVAQVLFFAQIAIHPMLETFLLHDVREPVMQLVTCNCLNKQRRASLDSADDNNNQMCFACLEYGNNKCTDCFHLLNASFIPHHYHTNNTNASSGQSQPSFEDKL